MSGPLRPIRFGCNARRTNSHAGKFVELIPVGKDDIVIKDASPNPICAITWVRGDPVNTILLPVGETPTPSRDPKRPAGSDEPEEDFGGMTALHTLPLRAYPPRTH